MQSTDPPEAAPAAENPADARDRQTLFEARDLALGGLFGALSVVLPIAFHALGPGVGPVFLPMYLPILALGLLVSWEVALIVGIAAPVLSSVLTGMPPLAPPIAPLMACELAALAAGASLARRVGLTVWPAAIIAILASRAAGACALLTIGHALGYNKGIVEYAFLSLAVSWPGMLLQLIVVPGVALALEGTSILGSRWRKQSA